MRIRNITDDLLDIEVIRYFNHNDNEYLIYSLGETDEAGYVKLYASKVVDFKACIITDNDEWDLIKQLIKDIVRSNRDGSELSITDLDEEELENVTLQDTRVFKLQGNLVTLLSENKKVVKKEVVEENEEVEETEEIIDEKVDYEVLYNDQLNKNKDLINQLEEVQQELDKCKSKLSSIKDLLEESY